MTRRLRRNAAATLVLLGALGAFALLVLARPRPLDRSGLPVHTPDAARGEVLYYAGSCGACHEAADGAPGADRGLPTGSAAFPTPIGTFYPGNLTPDLETGIGRWSQLEFVNAMTRGVSPEGTHYFPAFPYPSFRDMTLEDVLDLHAYLVSLPAVRSPDREPELPLTALTPLARRGVGLWKQLALRGQRLQADATRSNAWNRGAYLSNAPGHCGECHTPRNWLMIADDSRHFEGGPHPGGKGAVPSLRRLIERGRYKDVADLTLALRFGETLGYDKLSSGNMAKIQMNLARLPESEVEAISEYLLSLE
jgi:mono/diheme cytochrome c family protein